MQLILIAAFTENRVLGRENRLIWHLPEDLKHFKRVTTGFPVLMGRKTYESVGRPLPNRLNIVVSRTPGFRPEGCLTAASLHQAVQQARESGAEKAFVIGGGELYRQALPLADTLCLTHIHATLEGDTFFPEIPKDEWQVVDSQPFAADERHAFAFDIATWRRVPR